MDSTLGVSTGAERSRSTFSWRQQLQFASFSYWFPELVKRDEGPFKLDT